MSQRGSFVTEYVYCPECFSQLREFFIEEKHKGIEKVIQLINENEELIPILARKTKMEFFGEEKLMFKYDYIPRLNRRICHKLNITVLGEGLKERYIFTLKPSKDKK